MEKIVALQYSEDELLQYIASLNQYSEHPLAQAVVKFAKAKNVSLTKVDDFENIAG